MSFTHLIGYAVVQALKAVPVLNSTFVAGDDGEPPRSSTTSTSASGLAVDVEKSDGSHTLLVPCIKEADTLDFRGFWVAYEDLIRKVRTNKIGVDDFAGATVTLTNPGTIGTVQSVPRLMPGQGVIVGVGALDYPAEYQAADPRMLAELGVSKVITLTSTYDHRIIQGAESGLFLQRVHQPAARRGRLLRRRVPRRGVPYEPVRWRRDVNPVDEEQASQQKQIHVQTLINMYRVRGHLIADLDPLAAKEPHMHAELDPATYGLTIWDLDREFSPTAWPAATSCAWATSSACCATPTAAPSASSTCTSRSPTRSAGSRSTSKGVEHPADARGAAPHPRPAQRGRGVRAASSHTKYVGQKRFGLEGAESAIPILDAVLDEAAKAGLPEVGDGHGPSRPAQRAGQHRGQVLLGRCSASSRATSTRTPPRARAT